ncbi:MULTISPECIES: hypothetical protein [unclassified Gilliamella]|uniref:hypothetical protein n=1 Tax=unclassified Gilliamella TaxID=2685620 RepID=UPI001329FA66|nr:MULTISPECIES: hypothetical protein [unclassified Gilliamella]MWN32083.1 hypothetical protein [Gilliamella sp. Pra-s60]MWP29342.1 hypothetical protein [Gilliamella sp. Pra-s54]
MSFGIKVFTKTGPAYHLDGNCTSMFISGALGSDVYPETGLYVPEGYDYYAHLSHACGFADEFDETDANVIVASIDPIAYLDESRQLCFRNGKNAKGWSSQFPSAVNLNTRQQLVLLTWPKPAHANGHGILFNGVNSFFQINQNTNFSNVIWKGDIEITNSGWRIQNINPSLTHHNSFVFFYCEDPTISIGRSWQLGDRDDIVYIPYDHNGNVSNRIIKAKAVVFGVSSIKTSKYGLRIYKNKRVVYDSCNEVLLNPVFVRFDQQEIGQMKSISGIRRPMCARVSVGAQYIIQSHGGWFCDIGIRSNGYQLSTTVQKAFNVWKLETELSFNSFISEQPVMILDAENYFKF